METREQQGLCSACPLCHLIIGPQSLSHLPWQCRFCGAEAAWHSIKSKRHRQACAQEPFRGCWTECAFQVRFPSDSDPPLWSIFVCGRGLAKSMTASQTTALVDKTCCLLVALSYLNRTAACFKESLACMHSRGLHRPQPKQLPHPMCCCRCCCRCCLQALRVHKPVPVCACGRLICGQCARAGHALATH